MSNTITAYFKGRKGVAESLYQNDYGMVMAFDGIELPALFDCYFSIQNQEEAVPGVGADNRVAIPNSVLANPGKVEIHIPLHTGSSDSEVEYVVYFRVIGRARPVDDGTPAQMTAIEQALALLQNPITNIEQIVNEALDFTGDTFAEMQEQLDANQAAFQDDMGDRADAFEAEIRGDIADVESDFDNLNAQFQTAVGALTVDDELLNVRVGDDNVTYATAGEAVRKQFSALKSELNVLGEVDTTWVDGYLSSADGRLMPPTADAEKASDFIPVLYGSTVKIIVRHNATRYMMAYIYAYDADEVFIGRVAIVNGGQAKVFEVSGTVSYANAKYVRMAYASYDDDLGASAFVFSHVDEMISEAVAPFNTSIETINRLEDLCFQFIDIDQWESDYYYNWNGGQTDIVKNSTSGGAWNAIAVLNMPAGTYHYNKFFHAGFSFIKNLTTGVVQKMTDAGFVETANGTITINYPFSLYVTTHNSLQDISTAMIANGNLPSSYSYGYYKDYTEIDAKIDDKVSDAVELINADVDVIRSMENIEFQYIDTSAWEASSYYNWNSGQTALIKNSAGEAWHSLVIKNLPAGTYHFNKFCSLLFSFVENINTGEIEGVSDVGITETVNGSVTINYPFNLYLSANSGMQNLETTMFSSGNLPAEYAYGWYKDEAQSYYVNAQGQTVWIVGNGYIPTIQEACDRATENDIIFIRCGTYTEQVSIWDKKLHLIGENKANTILIDHSGNYNTPPLEMSLGSLSNLTVIEDGANPTGAGTSSYMMAYCLHIEWTPHLPNEVFKIDNCDFINYIHSPLGCGLYQDYTVHFKDCTFRCEASNEGNNERGSFYFHSNIQPNITGQKIIAENCVISSAGQKWAVLLGVPSGANNSGSAEARFSNCCIWNDNVGNADSIAYFDTSGGADVLKVVNSYGNTVAALNS